MESQFERLRKQSLGHGRLFEDPDFRPGRTIYSDGSSEEGIEWKRPHEFCANPEFITEGISRLDLSQGDWGDCWFVAAAVSLTTKPELFSQVVPEDQGFDDNYAGIFHFNFWWDGDWVEVVVDDRLPLRDGRLVFGCNTEQPNEMWGALLEKAYAKLHGTYSGIYAGFVRDALVNFTGGLSESYNLKKKQKVPENLFTIMYESFKSNALLGCGIYQKQGATTEVKLSNGLFAGHAYTITCVTEISVLGSNRMMLRLRNPWGEGEWSGRWSDGSADWRLLSEGERRDLGLVVEEDGEFWMEFSDWKEHFSVVDIVHLTPKTFAVDHGEVSNTSVRGRWHESIHHGAWVRGVNAGGAGLIGDPEMLYRNPQYVITLETLGEEDDRCECVISLMQKYQKPPPGIAKPRKLLIGFDLFKIKDGLCAPLDGDSYDSRALRVTGYHTRTNQREISRRIELEPGNYCLIPSALKPDQEGKFLLRLYTKKPIKSSFIDEVTRPVVRPLEPDENLDIEVKEPDGLPSLEDGISLDTFFTYAGKDFVVDAKELRRLLRDLSKERLGQSFDFNDETCRCLLAKQDANNNGALTCDEVEKLWQELKLWKEIFEKYDEDNTNQISVFQVRRLFGDIGYSLSFRAMWNISIRYGGKQATMNFEDFVLCATRFLTLYAAFKHFADKTGDKASISLEDWMSTTMLC